MYLQVCAQNVQCIPVEPWDLVEVGTDLYYQKLSSAFYTSCHKESRIIFNDSYLRVCKLENIEKLREEHPLMLPGANNTDLSDDICCLLLSHFCFSPDIVIESDCSVNFLDSTKKHPLVIFSFLFLHFSFSVPSAEEFLPVMYH